MPPAVIAGGIAAVGTIGGALISSHSQNSAIDSANASQQAATQAQLELGHESLDLQKQLAQQSMGLNQSLYNSNYDLLSPFVSRGNVAGGAINALLGLPNAPNMRSPLETASGGLTPLPGSQPAPTGGTTTPAPAQNALSLSQIMAMQNDGIPGNYQANLSQYYAANPPTAAQIAAMRNDGIPGNYAAASGTAPQRSGSLLTMNPLSGIGLAANLLGR
jgi:hypothetical protein